jgi:pimeloyl-ACP methyl ester carboxylesterase/nucleoside-diphosphate-sugar epimerase
MAENGLQDVPGPPEVLVTGATGFIGRWVVLELAAAGRPVAVLLRRASEQIGPLRAWVAARGGEPGLIVPVEGDLTVAGLGFDDATDEALRAVRDVFSLAGRFEFGLGVDEARAANVDGPLHLARWAGTRADLRRLLHVSGYRVNGQVAVDDLPLSGPARAALYERLGAYEASKLEGDAELRAEAARTGLPLTVINPSTVVGAAATGETTQFIGLAASLGDLWRGKLPLVPGNRRTFVPVVAVDHLARVMVALAERDDPAGAAYWVLHDDTPPLVDLVEEAARHLGVRRPRGTIPSGLVRRLPARLTGADPETLSFLSEDRYPTGSYRQLLDELELAEPPTVEVLHRWLDHLVDVDFGPDRSPIGARFVDAAGSRTLVTGATAGAAVVLLHGLPHDGRTWDAVAGLLPTPSLRIDLPGVSRSSPSAATHAEWLAAVLDAVAGDDDAPSVLVGHSLGTAAALEHASADPGRVRGLVLVSPFFLQRTAPWFLRLPGGLQAPLLRRATPARLAGRALEEATAAYQAAAANLRRPGVARRVAATLRAVSAPAARQRVQAMLEALEVPVVILAGERDPLTVTTRHRVVTVPGGGHDLHLTHPRLVAEAIAALVEETEPRPAASLSIADSGS